MCYPQRMDQNKYKAQANAFNDAWVELDPYHHDLHSDCERCNDMLVEIFKKVEENESKS